MFGDAFIILLVVCCVFLREPQFGARGVFAEEVCEHSYLNTHIEANCSNKDWDHVPWGLHHTINTLDLSNNRFTRLAASAFKGYSKLQVLRLRNNSIRMVHADALANLKQLHTLDLANNHLSSVPTDMLAKVPSLMTLSLAGNSIMLVSDGAFQSLSNLKTLILSGNRIGELEPNALLGLPKLQKLHLEHNSLRSLPGATFTHLSPDLLDMHLHDNPWICDCRIRWMHQWMANGTSTIWQHAGQAVVCDGPSISRGKLVSSIPLDELACKVEMRTSGSTQIVKEGQEAVMECVYFSIPTASPVWHKNGRIINFHAHPDKYSMTTEGSPLTNSKLHVKDFQYDDIAAYKCLAQNVRGSDSTVFKVTLHGVPFPVSGPSHAPSSSAGVDTKSIVIAVGVVCGIILVVVLSVLIFCCAGHIKRRQQEKRDAVVENVKKHFLANGEMIPKEMTDDVDKSKLDQMNDDTNSESIRTIDTNTTPPKQPIEEYSNNKEPNFTYPQPISPFNTGNTYVSFGSEMTEPESLQMYPQANSTLRYDGSQTESTTPLLDRYTPSVFDSDDPYDETPHYPVYEAATLYHPRRNHFPGVNGYVPPLTPGSTRSSTRSTTFIPANTGHYPEYVDYQDMRYPYNISPEQQMLASKKSRSVGNLGYQPAPRKPPRMFHSREYVEPSPHNTSASASDYMSLPYQTSHYGIKPGTPV